MGAKEIIEYLEINNFERVNKFHIINLDFIKNNELLGELNETEIKMQNGEFKKISIGKSFKEGFK